MNYDVMIIVDMQTALVKAHPYNESGVIENIKQLLLACREKEIPVIYVRHDGGKGDELECNTDGWQIYSEIKPLQEEKIFEKKYNSAFRQTGLHAYLDSIKAKSIILVGMQTEYCLDTTCKVAFELGYNMTIPKRTTTTYDNEFATGKDLSEYYENKIWNKRFARVIPVEQIITEM